MASYYSGAGDGKTKAAALSWDAAHDATSITMADYDYTSTLATVSSAESKGTFTIIRGFLPIDTSGINDTATILSAKFYLMQGTGSPLANGDNDGDDWLNIVGQTTQASPTSLGINDFDNCGSIDNPTEGATRIDFTTIKWSQYSNHADNGSGFVRVTSNTNHTLSVGDYVYLTPLITPAEYRGWHTVTNVTDNTHYDLDVAYTAGSVTQGYAVVWQEFILNSTGISWIKKTVGDPYTMFGIREGHDCIDSSIATGYENGFIWFTSEETSGNSDPYLDVLVLQTYVIFQFKDYSPVGNEQGFNVTWQGQTNLAPSISPVVLQIYNFDTSTWVNLAQNVSSDVNTDFELSAWIGDSGEDISAYHNSANMICCRVYQGGGS